MGNIRDADIVDFLDFPIIQGFQYYPEYCEGLLTCSSVLKHFERFSVPDVYGGA